MWILPHGLKQQTIAAVQSIKDELKTRLEAETYGEAK
jgi:hypothetical protein